MTTTTTTTTSTVTVTVTAHTHPQPQPHEHHTYPHAHIVVLWRLKWRRIVWTAIGQGLVDLERQRCSAHACFAFSMPGDSVNRLPHGTWQAVVSGQLFVRWRPWWAKDCNCLVSQRTGAVLQTLRSFSARLKKGYICDKHSNHRGAPAKQTDEIEALGPSLPAREAQGDCLGGPLWVPEVWFWLVKINDLIWRIMHSACLWNQSARTRTELTIVLRWNPFRSPHIRVLGQNSQLFCADLRWSSKCAQGMCTMDCECPQNFHQDRQKLGVEPLATVGLSLNSASSRDVSYDFPFTALKLSALKPYLVRLARESDSKVTECGSHVKRVVNTEQLHTPKC